MAILLPQSTAYTFRLGPFLDSTDGNTQENALTIAYTDVLLSKAGGALTAKAETTNLTGTGANAHYTCVLGTGDTGTLGSLRVWCHVTGALCVYQDFLIVPALVYNSLVAGSDNLQVDTIQVAGTVQTAGDLATMITAVDDFVDTEVAAIKTDTAAILIDTAEIGVAGAGLTAVPWNAAWDAQVESEVDDALVARDLDHLVNNGTAVPAVTAGTFLDQMMDDGTAVYDRTTDSLQAIRDTAPLGTTMRGTDGAYTGGNITGNLSGSVGSVTGAVGSVTGDVGGNVTGSVGSIASNGINNNSLHSNACSKITDSGIQRGASNWENNSDDRSLGWAISKLVNKIDLNAAGDTLTIRKSNDSTALFTQSVTTSGGAAPVVSLDTA